MVNPLFLHWMKRIITFILGIVYFIVSTGFVVNVHYCAGKLSSIKFEQSAKKCCCKKKHKGCCKTEQKLAKLSSGSKLAEVWLANQYSIHAEPAVLYTVNFSYPVSQRVVIDLTHPYPPPHKGNKFAQLHYCVFRI